MGVKRKQAFCRRLNVPSRLRSVVGRSTVDELLGVKNPVEQGTCKHWKLQLGLPTNGRKLEKSRSSSFENWWFSNPSSEDFHIIH